MSWVCEASKHSPKQRAPRAALWTRYPDLAPSSLFAKHVFIPAPGSMGTSTRAQSSAAPRLSRDGAADGCIVGSLHLKHKSSWTQPR